MVVEGDEVVEVSADDLRREAAAQEREPGELRQGPGQQARLDVAGDLEVAPQLRLTRHLVVENRRLDRQRGLVRERRKERLVVPVEALAGELLLQRENPHQPLAVGERHEQTELFGNDAVAEHDALRVRDPLAEILRHRGLSLGAQQPAHLRRG